MNRNKGGKEAVGNMDKTFCNMIVKYHIRLVKEGINVMANVALPKKSWMFMRVMKKKNKLIWQETIGQLAGTSNVIAMIRKTEYMHGFALII